MSKNKLGDVKGKLSTRVMNMKFMKEAQQAEEDNSIRENERKLKDSSEWRVKGSDAYLRRFVKPRVVVSTGFVDVAWQSQDSSKTLHDGINPGRRKFGKPTTEILSSECDQNNSKKKRSPETEPDDDGMETTDLEKLWSEEKSFKKNKKLKK